MNDLISRQAAIEIIDGYMNLLAKHIGTPTDNERYAYARGTLLGVEAGINALPSSQSERTEQTQEETIKGIARFMAKKDWNRRTENG